MRIGVLTFWDVPNYGSFLQAYALQNTIKKIFPNDDVKVISYLNKKHYDKYYSVFDKDYHYWLINPRFYFSVIKRFKGRKNLNNLKKFLSYYDRLEHTERYDSKALKKAEFDVVVLGSDIIWDYSISFFGNDRFLFGNDLNAKNILSYAASFGTSKKEKRCPEFVTTGISNLKNISVRDDNSYSIIKEVFNRECEKVLDPTFLWDFENDSNIATPNIEEDYVLVYGTFFTDDMILNVKRFCENKNLKIICLNSLDDKNDWSDVQINQESLTPFEWVGYFKKAKYIMTCTFHGLMFGIIFKKPIIFNQTDFILAKSDFLIKYLELSDILRISANANEISIKEWAEKYDRIEQLLYCMKEKSLSYLTKAILE